MADKDEPTLSNLIKGEPKLDLEESKEFYRQHYEKIANDLAALAVEEFILQKMLSENCPIK